MTWIDNKKWFFCDKFSFWSFNAPGKMPFLDEIGFLAHFWQSGSVTFFWRDQKTKSDFFVKNITFHFLSKLFWWLEKWATVIAQNYFGKFCYCVPGWKILKHGFLEPLGDPLSPCNSLLLWTRLFIQIHSETLWLYTTISIILFCTWLCLRCTPNPAQTGADLTILKPNYIS